jgi:hypothetical protein
MRAQAKAERTGRHQRDTLVKKAARWLTYSVDEAEARDQQKGDAYDREHQVEVMTSPDGVEIPVAVHATNSHFTPSRRELRYMQTVGALDNSSFETGNAEVALEARALKMPLAPTVEQQEVDLILSGARSDQEVFNEMYGDRVVGGSTVYGGRLLAEGSTLRRKLGEAGRISTTNQDNIGPVERGIAHHYAERMAVVANLESQVTDRFVPSQTTIEAMLYGENGKDVSRDRTLTEDEMLVVKATQQRLEELREQKLRPGETVDTRVKPDHTHSIRKTWRSTKEALQSAAGKVHRAVGVVALHGAAWTDAALMIVQPEYTPTTKNPDHVKHHAVGPFEEHSGMIPSSVEPIRIYSPGELVTLASTWTFVRAQMIASGSLRGARDWFRPRDHETNERRVSALRLAGAAAVMVTAAATAYGYNRFTGGNVNVNNVDARSVQSTFGGRS